MKILLVGIDEVPHLGRSFRNALEALGHDVMMFDDRLACNWFDRGVVGALLRKISRRDQPLGAPASNRLLLQRALEFSPDALLAIKGEWIHPETLRAIGQTGASLLNYSPDDPFNPVVSNRRILASLPVWDLYATPRRSTLAELRNHCRGTVMHLRFAYDPDLHFPEVEISRDELQKFTSDVAFVGTCDRNRIPLLNSLTSLPDVDVALYGDGYYQKSEKLKASYRGVALGRDYRLALGCTKIAITLLRHTNRDHHTLRTFEVPACGAFMLAERTDEHEELFQEDREAAFFGSEEELLDKVKFYLAHPEIRDRIARAGHLRVISGSCTYRDRLDDLLAAAAQQTPSLAF